MRRIGREKAPDSDLRSQSVKHLYVIKVFFHYSKFYTQHFSFEKLRVIPMNGVKTFKACFILEILKMSVKWQ
jgi:hypothetical protein